MVSLRQLSEQLSDRYTGIRQITLPPEQLAVTEDGGLILPTGRLPMGSAAWAGIARYAKIPPSVLPQFDSSERAFLFNRRLSRAHELDFPQRVRVSVDSQGCVIGLCNASLLQVDISALMDTLTTTLPNASCAEEVVVDRCDASADGFELTVFSPVTNTEPRPGDVINGGIYLRHSVVGAHATQVHCFLRRLVCANGMVSHVCVGRAHGRTRRLRSNNHHVDEMLTQLESLLAAAWSQLTDKLAALGDLMNQPAADAGVFIRYRSRLSLNRRLIRAIEEAMNADEMEPTNSLSDFVNALSRVATHGDAALLTPRQRRTLLRAAGEFSQHRVRQCQACGSWLDGSSGDNASLN